MKGKSSKILAIFLSFCLLSQQLGFAQVALQLNLSRFLYQLGPVDKFRPLHMRYFSFDSAVNKFDLLLDKGDLKKISDEELRSQGQELFKYFLVGLTLPNKTFWVNLRPDSQERIIDPALEKTDVGKILLEADLQLKKDTARYTSPENPQGKEYWDRLYKKAAEIFGTENITIPTLTRPWIVPNEVIIRYNGSSAYVYKATLKVMLEQDYLKDSSTYNFNDPRMKELNVYASQQVRELIIPLLNKEINQSKRYAQLRQVFYSLILAQWFKQECNNSNSTYCRMIDRYKLNDLVSQESWSKDTYFQAYKKSFEQGEYNIKTPSFGAYGQTIRSYFSGGMNLSDVVVKAQVSSPLFGIQAAALNPQALGGVALTVTDGEVRVVSSPVRRKHLPPEPVIQGGDLIANGPIRLLDAPPRRKPAQKPSGLSPAIQKALAEGRSGPGRVSMSSPVMQNSPWVTEDLLTRNASDPLGRAIGELHFAAYRLNNAGASGFVITDLERKSFMINEEMSLASASMQQSTGSPEWENLNLAVMNDQDLKSNLKHATIVVVNSTEATEPRFLLNKNIYFIPKSLLTGIQDINFLLTQLVRERNMLFVRLEQAGVVSVNQQGEARLASNAQYSQVSLIAAQAHTIILQQAAKAASGSSPANLKELTGKYGDDKSHDMMGAMEAEGLTLEGFADILAHWQNDQWLTLNVFWNSYTFFLRQRTQGPKNWRVLDGVDFEALKKEIRVNLGQRKPASRKSSSPAVVEIGLDAEGRLPVYPPELADKLKRGESAAVSISTEAVDDKTRGLKEIKQVGIDIYAPLYPDGAFLSVSDQIAVKSQLGALTAAVKDVNLVNRLKDVIEIVFVKSLGETIYVRNFSADKKNPTSSLIFLDFSALEDRGWLQSSLEAALKHIEAAASSPTTERGEDIDSVSPDFTTSAITDIINAKSQLSPSFKALAYDALERAQRKYREWIGEPHGRFSVSRVEKIRRVVEILLPGAIQELERAEPDFRLVNAILLQIMSDLQGAGEKINWRVFASRERESGISKDGLAAILDAEKLITLHGEPSKAELVQALRALNRAIGEYRSTQNEQGEYQRVVNHVIKNNLDAVCSLLGQLISEVPQERLVRVRALQMTEHILFEAKVALWYAGENVEIYATDVTADHSADAVTASSSPAKLYPAPDLDLVEAAILDLTKGYVSSDNLGPRAAEHIWRVLKKTPPAFIDTEAIIGVLYRILHLRFKGTTTLVQIDEAINRLAGKVGVNSDDWRLVNWGMLSDLISNERPEGRSYNFGIYDGKEINQEEAAAYVHILTAMVRNQLAKNGISSSPTKTNQETINVMAAAMRIELDQLHKGWVLGDQKLRSIARSVSNLLKNNGECTVFEFQAFFGKKDGSMFDPSQMNMLLEAAKNAYKNSRTASSPVEVEAIKRSDDPDATFWAYPAELSAAFKSSHKSLAVFKGQIGPFINSIYRVAYAYYTFSAMEPIPIRTEAQLVVSSTQFRTLLSVGKKLNLSKHLSFYSNIVFVRGLSKVYVGCNLTGDPKSSDIFLSADYLDNETGLEEALRTALKHIDAAASSPTKTAQTIYDLADGKEHSIDLTAAQFGEGLDKFAGRLAEARRDVQYKLVMNFKKRTFNLTRFQTPVAHLITTTFIEDREGILQLLGYYSAGGARFPTKASSPTEDKQDMGGIDFRYINMVTQAQMMKAQANFRMPDLQVLKNLNLVKEGVELKKLMAAGIMPSQDRVIQFVSASRLRSGGQDEALVFVVDYLKLQEETNVETDPEFKVFLTVIDSEKVAG